MSRRRAPKGPGKFAMCRGLIEKSGGLLAGRIPWCGARSGSGRTAGRAATGFWRVGGRAEGDRKLWKCLADPGRGERAAGGALGPFPGQVHVVNGATGEAQLGVG